MSFEVYLQSILVNIDDKNIHGIAQKAYEDMDISIFNGKCPQCQADWDKHYEA